MIAADLRAKIRRLFFAEHWKVGTIASELGVHHDTVTHAIEAERFIRPGTQVRPTLLDPYKPFIAETLEHHPRLRATRLQQMLESRGYAGSVVQLRKYLKQVRPAAKREAFLQLSVMPGEQAQVDWAHFGKIRIGSAQRSLSCFVMVLSWSRAMYARFALDQTLESFLRGHVLGFTALGGVPRSVLYDNLRSVVLERHADHIRFHPRLLELAGHYHFAPKPCAPYRGNEKGRVERTIQYLRHSFFAARRFSSVDDLNAQLAEWTSRIAHTRKVPGDPDGRPVSHMLEAERPVLLPLPEHAFGVDLCQPAVSGKTPYIRFDLNDYSIPHDLCRRPLTLVASEIEVLLLDGQREVARHRRSYDRGQRVEDPAHIAALSDLKRRAHDLRGRDLLRTRCPAADTFLGALAARNERLSSHTAQLLTMVDRYGATEVDAALRIAVERQALSAASVAHILDQRRRAKAQPPPLAITLPDDPRVRDLRVVPHSLANYDTLCQPAVAADVDGEDQE